MRRAGGAPVVDSPFVVENPGLTATDHSIIEAKVGGTTSGDPQLRLTIPGGTSWYVGADNSASDLLNIGTGTAVGTNVVLSLSQGANQILNLNPGSVGTGYITANGRTVFTVVAGSVTVGSDASDDLILQAANAEWLRITTDGRVFGKALHNNAGSLTGTANHYVASGTYTPTLTGVTNVAASTARKCQWIRVGRVVHVSGSLDIDPTAAAATALGISLPIGSNLALATDLGGTAAGDQAAAEAAASIRGDAANDRAELSYVAVNVNNHTMYFSFSYEVL